MESLDQNMPEDELRRRYPDQYKDHEDLPEELREADELMQNMEFKSDELSEDEVDFLFQEILSKKKDPEK